MDDKQRYDILAGIPWVEKRYMHHGKPNAVHQTILLTLQGIQLASLYIQWRYNKRMREEYTITAEGNAKLKEIEAKVNKELMEAYEHPYTIQCQKLTEE